MDILLIYQFCSFGGVERAVLNRAKTFRKYGQDVHISMGYLQDFGALQSFQEYIRVNNLDECLSPFLINENAPPILADYDFVFVIDTPQFFRHIDGADNVMVECHTPYVDNRQYLKSLPKNILGITVPSAWFKSLVQQEFDSLPPVYILPNPVPEDFYDIPHKVSGLSFTKRPIAYLARLDTLKNFAEAARIFELFSKSHDVMFAVVGNGAEGTGTILDLADKAILGKSFLRDHIAFDDVPAFIELVKRHRGVFISPSTGESFGLSAAEFISAGVPVLLSDIGPHRELVNADERFLYPLGEIFLAREKIVALLNRWEDCSFVMESYGKKFTGEDFINAWRNVIAFQKRL